jgi:cysteine desulfurase
MVLFLDANAHLPLNSKALEAFSKFNSSLGGHGHAMSSSILGRTAVSALEDSRTKIARMIGASNPNQIFFTSTCTQACEWGLEILASQEFQQVYSSTIEHKSVAEKSRKLFGNNDLIVSKDGVVNCTFKPHNNTAFICIHVHNELGTIQPIEDIKVPFFSDMSQSIGKIPINVSSIPNLKIATFGAHKFGGPVGVGILYIQDQKWWKPFGSGSRYQFDRPGTPDVGYIVATAVALEEAIKTLPRRYENALAFKSAIEEYLIKGGIEVIAENAMRIPYTTFIKIGKKMAPYVMNQLESENIYVGLGSACGSVYSNSPIMTALGYGGKAHDYMRISQWGDYGYNEGLQVAKAIIKYSPKQS